ncbi:MAG: hypothetical protein HQL82_04865 [Magnetococcales bacterium]|nr:hypothetical protein [Magnetococcales bacterium]
MTDSHRFTLKDQQDFACLSGDFNPLHVDPAAARRLLFGQPAVHGIHAVARVLDAWLGRRSDPGKLAWTTLAAVFTSPMPLDEPLTWWILEEQVGRVVCRLAAGGNTVGTVTGTWRSLEQGEDRDEPSLAPVPRTPCRERSRAEVANAAGSLPLGLDHDLAARLLPNLIRRMPTWQLALLLATTRLVGMDCPGLDSIYSSLVLEFSPPGGPRPDRLDYRVTAFDDRFALVTLALQAPGGGTGTIEAFIRPRPREQAPFATLASLVRPDEFRGQRALIIGGSRGFGEVTAKLLAAGGAGVVLTHFQGAEAAQRIVTEITRGGGRAVPLFLDARAPDPRWAESLEAGWTPTHLYYFATPTILARNRGSFTAELFDRFCACYVTGFARLFAQVRERFPGCRDFFYPSSSHVADRPTDLGEYQVAKAAGEAVCAYLEKSHKGVRIQAPRLPRAETGQSVSLFPTAAADPAPLMLACLREFRELGSR